MRGVTFAPRRTVGRRMKSRFRAAMFVALVVSLLVPLSAAGQGQAVTADFTAARVSVTQGSQLQGKGFLVAMKAPPAGSKAGPAFEMNFTAKSLLVEEQWVNQTYVRVGSDGWYHTTTGGSGSRRFHMDGADGRASRSDGPYTYFMLTPIQPANPRSLFTVYANHSALEITAASNVDFKAGRGESRLALNPRRPWESGVDQHHDGYSWDAPNILVNATDHGPLVVEGSFKLEPFDMDFVLHDKHGRRETTRSGMLVESAHGVQGLQAGQLQYRKVKMTFTDARLWVDAPLRTIQANLGTVDLGQGGVMTLEEANGRLALGQNSRDLEDAQVELSLLEGAAHLQPSKSGVEGLQPLVSGVVSGRAEHASIGGLAIEQKAAVPGPSLGPLGFVGLAAALALVALWGRRHYGAAPQVLVERAEAHLVAGRFRRAAATAARALQKRPDDFTAALIQATAWVRMGRSDRALSRLEAIRSQDGTENAAVLFVRGVALAGAGRHLEAAQWLQAAIKADKSLVRHLRQLVGDAQGIVSSTVERRRLDNSMEEFMYV